MEIRSSAAQTSFGASYPAGTRNASNEVSGNIQPVVQQKQESLSKQINDIVQNLNKDAQNPEKMTRTELEEVVKEIQSDIEFLKNKLNFKVDSNFDNAWITQLLNKSTDEVISQFPPEYLLKISKSLKDMFKDMLKGIWVDEKT